jgi:hypothetical protein
MKTPDAGARHTHGLWEWHDAGGEAFTLRVAGRPDPILVPALAVLYQEKLQLVAEAKRYCQLMVGVPNPFDRPLLKTSPALLACLRMACHHLETGIPIAPASLDNIRTAIARALGEEPS